MSNDVQLYLAKLQQEVASTTNAPPPVGHPRLIFALDATDSRRPTWDAASHLTGTMFEAVAGLGDLNVQVMFYRGYNECKASKWVSTAAELHRLMRPVVCIGGKTQLARVLEHAIREAQKRRVGALIFIGDAMEEDGDGLCHSAARLGELRTPVFVLHEGRDADAAAWCKQLCDLSRGAYLPFELSSIVQLKTLLGAVAVYAAGGPQALTAYGRKHPGEVRQLTAQLARRNDPQRFFTAEGGASR